MTNEKLCEVKQKLIDVVYEVVTTGEIEDICASELGEVIDIIKDIEEAHYYADITEAMESSDDAESYVKKYVPAYSSRMYYHQDEEDEEVTMESVMDDIDEIFNECTTKEECTKKKQELINFINKIPM